MIHDLALRSPRSLSICPSPGASLRGDAESYNTLITFGPCKLSCFRDPCSMLVPFVCLSSETIPKTTSLRWHVILGELPVLTPRRSNPRPLHQIAPSLCDIQLKYTKVKIRTTSLLCWICLGRSYSMKVNQWRLPLFARLDITEGELPDILKQWEQSGRKRSEIKK